jgi:hypothetical protein
MEARRLAQETENKDLKLRMDGMLLRIDHFKGDFAKARVGYANRCQARWSGQSKSAKLFSSTFGSS